LVPTPTTPAKAAARRRRLSDEMLRLGTKIDKQQPGSAQRLDLLRQQASLSDEREALRSGRH